MKYELREVDTIVSTYLRPFNVLDEMDASQRIELKQLVRNEKRRICNVMMETMANVDGDVKKAWYVMSHQKDLVRLMNKVHGYRRREKIKQVYQYHGEGLDEYFLFVQTSLIELLAFLHRNYRTYFDADMALPAMVRTVNVDIAGKMERKILRCLQQEGVRKELTAIVLTPFGHIAGKEYLSVNDLWYLKNYVRNLREYFFRCKHVSVPLCDFLLEQEMNTDVFKRYYLTKLKTMLVAFASPRRKLNYCYYHLKILNQTAGKAVKRFDERLPSVRGELIAWIEQEAKFIERTGAVEKADQRQLKIESSFPDFRGRTAHSNVESGLVPAVAEEKKTKSAAGKKVKLNVAAATLAHWTRLMVKKQIIATDNVEGLLEVVAKAFTTLRSDEISAGKLSNSYHSPEPWTINIVKDQVIGMLNMLNKE